MRNKEEPEKDTKICLVKELGVHRERCYLIQALTLQVETHVKSIFAGETTVAEHYPTWIALGFG